MIYVAWDVLGLDQAPATAVGRAAPRRAARRAPPRAWRRLALPLAADGGRFALDATWSTADSVDGLEAAFAEARARRNEGLMVKDPPSAYSPGRRGPTAG